MPKNIDDLLRTAKRIQTEAALKEGEKADQFARGLATAEAEKKKLIDKLSKPSGLSEEEKVQLASNVIQRAVRSGLSEVQVHRFPNSLCTDRGRARAAIASAIKSSIFRAAFPATSASF